MRHDGAVFHGVQKTGGSSSDRHAVVGAYDDRVTVGRRTPALRRIARSHRVVIPIDAPHAINQVVAKFVDWQAVALLCAAAPKNKTLGPSDGGRVTCTVVGTVKTFEM